MVAMSHFGNNKVTESPRSDSDRRRITALFGRFSLLQQWVAATILSVLPLLLAVTYAGLSLQQQNSNQRALLERVDRVGAEGGAVADHIKEMVRLSRQYALLQEPSFL